LPFGYLFLASPPEEEIPIPFFRSNGNDTKNSNINVYDTNLLMQQRQDWLKNYLIENGFEPLEFVGKYKNTNHVKEIVANIRKVLNLAESWAS
jgi:hypothetical protein